MTTLAINLNDRRTSARFAKYADKRGPDECWPWTGARWKSGHGMLWDGRRHVAAHRYSLAVSGVAISDKLVCHKCNNSWCVNPAHLYAGDHASNLADAIAFGTARPLKGADHGSANCAAKLDEERAAAVRSRYVAGHPKHGGRALGREFGVSQAAISKIICGLTWTHV